MTDEKRSKAGGRQTASAARARTVKHLKLLLKSSTLGGAALAIGGCEETQVYDPAPPPFVCRNDTPMSEYSLAVSGSASWVEGAQGLVVSVSLSIQVGADDDPLSFTGGPALVGGTLLDSTWDAGSQAFTLEPDTGVTEVELSIPVDCAGDGDQLLYLLDISGTPEDGGYVPIENND